MHVRAAFCVLLTTLPAFQKDSTTLSDVMLRAHDYVVGYEKDLSGVMSEERWVQRIVARDGQIVAERTLRSDYLVFQLPPNEDWFNFRDVFEVDGQPVADREQRFRELFTRGPSSVIQQAMKIAAENARYNLGDVYPDDQRADVRPDGPPADESSPLRVREGRRGVDRRDVHMDRQL